MDRLPSSHVSALAEILKQTFSHIPAPVVEQPAAPPSLQQTPAPFLNMLEIAELVSDIKQKIAKLEKILSLNAPDHTRQPERTADGVFDGTCMIDAEGTPHPMPENYVSKSKLVEGDLLQALFMPNGRIIFKQLERVERKLTTGYLKEESGQFVCSTEFGTYKVLKASITFWRALPGDKLLIAIPKNGMSTWAAVEKKEL